MKNITLFILLWIGSVLDAQKISYEKLDSISVQISKFQLQSENLIYNISGTKYELGFPENNFQIFFSNNLATKVLNKKFEDKEFVSITENIDISQADKIYQVPSEGDLGIVRMDFPKGVNTQIYTNGVYTTTVHENYLEFFYNRNNKDSRKKLLTQLDDTFKALNLGSKISKEEFLAEESIKMDLPKKEPAKMLTADQIIKKYVAAMGGEEKIKSIKTLYVEGDISMQGMKIPVRSWFINHQAMRMDMEIQGHANTTVVTNNGSWTLFPIQNQKRPVDADSTTAKESAEELDLSGDLLDYANKGNIVELLGAETQNGRDLYKIKLIRKSGTVITFFIEAGTFFLIKRVVNKNVQGTSVEMTETIGDYKINNDGYVYASSYHYSPAGTALIYHRYEVNKDVDSKLFDKP